MPDWIKRINKERQADLQPGEQLIAASYYQGRGSALGQLIFGVAREVGTGLLPTQSLADRQGAEARDRVVQKARDVDNTPAGSIAGAIPDDKGVIAFTDHRIIVFGYKQGMFKTAIEDVAVSIDQAQLTGWSFSSAKVAGTLNMAFADGSDIGIEIPWANKPDEFAATLGVPAAE